MSKINRLILLIFSLFGVINISYAQKDTTDKERIGEYINAYLSTVPLNTDSLIAASDYLINLTQDTSVQQEVAHHLLNEFYNSKIMGVEGVAIHIAKNYFLNHRLKLQNDDDFFALKLYVACNERSLLGMDAPELNLMLLNSKSLSLRSLKSDYTAVLFYDEQCPICKKEIPLIRQVIDGFKEREIMVYAVYTQSDTSLLTPYLKREFGSFSISGSNAGNWFFVWDQNFESNFQILYNVMKSPQLFLLDSDKRIIGRNLNAESLKSLLLAKESQSQTETTKLEKFFSNYLSLTDMKNITEVDTAFNQLYRRTISLSDKNAYRSIFSNLFEYLYGINDADYDRALLLLYDKYIIPNSDLYTDKGLINNYMPSIIERVKKTMPGNIAHNITLYNINNNKIQIDSVKSKYTLLYFFNPDCAICNAFSMEMKRIYNSLVKRGVTIIAIYTGSDYDEFSKHVSFSSVPWCEVWDRDDLGKNIWRWYNVRNVPQLYLLDSNKRIIATRINTIELDRLIK